VRHPFLRTLAGSGVTTDPNFENVTLLLHGDGTNGGQNNTFVDGSTNNFTITRNGNTTQGTFSPYGDNWSNFFDGTDDYLSIADNANLRAGSGTFTIEAWIYRNATGAAHTIYAKGGASTGIVFQVASTNVLRFTHTTTNIDSTGTIGLATWTHVAVVREGTGTNETKLYINGTQDGTGTVSTDFTQTEEVRIGTDRSAAADFNGYISNLRFVKGTAVYTGAFTVPTSPLTAISNTQLLTCKSNRFRDESANAFTVTRNNNASVQRFSPFSPTAAYASGTIGGSGYFDGTGDNLSISSATGLCDFAAGQAFTFQVWLYRLGTGSMLFIQGGSNTFQVFVGSSTGGWGYGKAGVADVLTGAGAAPIGAWSHCAICRDTSNRSRIWVNGVSVASSTSDTYSYNTAATYIGSNSASSSSFVQGYLSDMRILKGQALYDPTSSANIDVPAAPLSAVTNTSFLLNFQNAAILDNAMMAVPETVGNAQIDTTTKKFGTGSLEFDGTGDYLTIRSSDTLVMGTGDFTVEFWIYLVARTTYGYVFASGPGTNDLFVSFDTNGNFLRLTNQATVFAVTGTIALTTWTHIAVVRSGSSSKIYVDGTGGTAVTCTTNFTATAPSVGASNTGTNPMNGFIDDLRITKGVARYTANFTAPTAAFPDL
jgi:hypothetical protein